MRLLNLTNGYLHYYRNAAKQRNIFYKMPTTIGTQIYRYRRTRPDCNSAFEKRMRGHRAMVVVCVDCTVTPINHSKILTQNFRRQHSIRNVRAPPCDSICPKYCRTKCLLECCTVMMPEWSASFDALPKKSLLLVGLVSKMVLLVWWMILTNDLKMKEIFVEDE